MGVTAIKNIDEALTKKENLHNGHRKRLKRKLVNDYSGAIENHELLEILLFYSISRRNTNETAHELLEKFGSFSSLMKAESDELKKIFYVKRSSCALIGALSEMNRRKNTKNEKYDFSSCYEKCAESVLKLMAKAKQEGTYIIWLNRKGGLLLASLIKSEGERLEEKLFYGKSVFGVGVGGAVIVSFSRGSSLIPQSIVLEKVKFYEEKLEMHSIPVLEYYLYNGEKVFGVRGKEKYDLAFHKKDENQKFNKLEIRV